MNDAVKYFEMDKRRDPTQLRTEWILAQLLRRPHSSDELEREGGRNGLGFAGSTYKRDLRGLVNRRLVCVPTKAGGVYTIDPIHGAAWAYSREQRILKERECIRNQA